MGVYVFSPTPSISPTLAGWPTTQLISDRSHRFRAQSYQTVPHLIPFQMPTESPGCHLYFWRTGHRLEVPMTPSSGVINLLEWFTELRNILLTRSPVYYKRIKLRDSQWKRCTEQGVWEEVWCFLALWVHPLPKPSCIHQPGTLWAQSFGGFVEASLLRCDWSNHWWRNSISSSSPLPRGHGVGLKVLTL